MTTEELLLVAILFTLWLRWFCESMWCKYLFVNMPYALNMWLRRLLKRNT